MTKSIPFFLVALVLCGTRSALARQDTVLPDLAPREVEITGDLAISFPSLRRQPLIGFNPPPRVPEISDSRRPFTEPYKQPSADLPPSPLTPPEPPNVSTIAQRFPVRGVVDGAVGRYLDRRLRADLTLGSSDTDLVLFSGSYFGTSGTQPYPAPAGSSGRNVADGRMFAEHVFGSLAINGDLEGSYRSYELFGAQPSSGSISLASPERRISGASFSVGLRSFGTNAFRGHVRLQGGTSRVETDLYDPAVRDDPATKRSERFVHADAAVKVQAGAFMIGLDGQGRTTGLDESALPGATLRSGQVNAFIGGTGARDLRIKAGASLLAFDSKSQNSTSATRSMAWLAPLFRADLPFGTGLQLSLATEPEIDEIDLRGIYQDTPTLMDEPQLYPNLASINAWSGLSYTSEILSGRVRAGWKDYPHYRYVRHSNSTTRGYERGYPETAYDEANVLYGGAELSLILTTGFQAGLEYEYRKGELSGSNSEIPYYSRNVTSLYFLSAFLDDQLTFEVTGTREGRRIRSESNPVEIAPWVMLDLEGSWFFNPNYGVLAGVRNLGADPEFWDRYPLESTALYVGARARW